MMKKINKKGFSIVEVVIAMAVITLVTVTAISIATGADKNARTALYRTDAQLFAADAVECFKATKNVNDFKNALESRGVPGYESEELTTTLFFNLSPSGYVAIVIYDTNSISVTVSDNSNIVTQLTYTKGVAG